MNFKKKIFWVGASVVLIVSVVLFFDLYSNEKYTIPKLCEGNVLLEMGDLKLLVSRETHPFVQLEGSHERIFLRETRIPNGCDIKKLDSVTSVRWSNLLIRVPYKSERGFWRDPKNASNDSPLTILCDSPLVLEPKKEVSRCQGSYRDSSGLAVTYWYSGEGKHPQRQYEQFERRSRAQIQEMIKNAQNFDAVIPPQERKK